MANASSGKLNQRVECRVTFADGEVVGHVLEGTNNQNLRSRIGRWIDEMVLHYNLNGGAKVEITLAPAEANEFANPER